MFVFLLLRDDAKTLAATMLNANKNGTKMRTSEMKPRVNQSGRYKTEETMTIFSRSSRVGRLTIRKMKNSRKGSRATVQTSSLWGMRFDVS